MKRSKARTEESQMERTCMKEASMSRYPMFCQYCRSPGCTESLDQLLKREEEKTFSTEADALVRRMRRQLSNKPSASRTEMENDLNCASGQAVDLQRDRRNTPQTGLHETPIAEYSPLAQPTNQLSCQKHRHPDLVESSGSAIHVSRAWSGSARKCDHRGCLQCGLMLKIAIRVRE
jgi:hypothetical protein